MGQIEHIASELGVLFATDKKEMDQIRRRTQDLEKALDNKFGGIPNLKEFCREVEVEYPVDPVKNPELTEKDFAVAVFSSIIGFPTELDEDQYEVACEKEELDIYPEHLKLIGAHYNRLL